MEIGRNSPCPCGSGNKYKKCHLNRPEPPTFNEFTNALKRAQSGGTCLAPTRDGACENRVIRSHSIPRGASMKLIARDSHVMTLRPNLTPHQFDIVPRKAGINEATTFGGFCSTHDAQLFSSIEQAACEPTQEQAWAFGFRPLAREMFARRAAMNLGPKIADAQASSPPDAVASERWLFEGFDEGQRQGWGDIVRAKKRYDAARLREDYTGLRFVAIKFDDVPDVMCSVVTLPEVDFDGHKLSRPGALRSKLPSPLSFNLVGNGHGGIAIFCWLDGNEAAAAFAASLTAVRAGDLANALVRYSFEFSENVVFDPDWWEHLSPALRRQLMWRVTTAIKSPWPRSAGALVDDGLDVAHWTVADIVSNGYLPVLHPSTKQ